jgi:alkylation response protein AidB-like acyl-CoA dehydrogenase
MVQTMERSSGRRSPADLPEALRDAIQAQRDEAERLRRLPDGLTDVLRAAGAFGLTTPIERAGAELSLTALVDLYEAFGRIDGPVAWTIWNGNMGFAAAMLDPAAADRIWTGERDPVVANSARVTGTALGVDGGYRLSGRWDIVSAVDAADWAALFGVVLEGDGPRFDAHGAPDVRVFFVPRADMEVIDTWHTSGMRGTGSNSVVVEGAIVAEDLAISPFAPALLDRPLYRIPAFTIASCGAAPIVVGIAQAALDEVVALAPSKATDGGQVLAQRGHAHTWLGAAQTSLDAARALLRQAASTIDAMAAAGEAVDELPRARLRAAMSHAAQVARDVLSRSQQLASSTAVYTDNRIERLVRDGNVAAQHMILSATHIDILGRLMVGQPAGTPIV